MSAESSAAIINKLKEKEQKTMKKTTLCTLYTFAKPLYNGIEHNGVGIVKVARLTTGHPVDWHEWPDIFIKDHPQFRLLEIAGIEWVDDRDIGDV